MAFARIVTKKKGTTIRTVRFNALEVTTTVDVDRVASTLDSIICEEQDILKVEVDYTGCDNSALE